MKKVNSHERRYFRGFVFRNLHQKGVVWSVRDSAGHTVFHADNVLIKNAKFVVQKGGQAKVRATRCKFVHAGVRGEIVVDPIESNSLVGALRCPHTGLLRAYYNPYTTDTFVDSAGSPLSEASAVMLTHDADGKSLVLWLPK